LPSTFSVAREPKEFFEAIGIRPFAVEPPGAASTNLFNRAVFWRREQLAISH
jgi:hypothetical protein